MAASNAGVGGQASAISNNAAVATNNANMNSPSSLGLVNNAKVSNATSKYGLRLGCLKCRASFGHYWAKVIPRNIQGMQL